MENRVLSALVQGANVVNQASQTTSQTLAQMENNVAHQAQARQMYTNQMLDALQKFQQAQIAENQLVVQKTFDIQNQYLNTLIKSNENFMNQRRDILDLDLKVEKLKQDKAYQDKMYTIEKLKEEAYIETMKSQIAKMQFDMNMSNKKFEIEKQKTDAYVNNVNAQTRAINYKLEHPENTKPVPLPKNYSETNNKFKKDLLTKNPEDVVKSVYGWFATAKGISEYAKLRNDYLNQYGVDLNDTLFKINPNMRNIFDKSKILQTVKTKDGKVKTIPYLNMKNTQFIGLINNTINNIKTGNISVTDGFSSIYRTLKLSGIKDELANRVAMHTILPNLTELTPTQLKDAIKLFEINTNSINNYTQKTRIQALKDSVAFVNNNISVIKNDKELFNKTMSSITKSTSMFKGLPELANNEKYLNEFIQELHGNDYDILGFYPHDLIGESLKTRKEKILSRFGSKEAFVGYTIYSAMKNSLKYGANLVKVLQEPIKTYKPGGYIENAFSGSDVTLKSKNFIDKHTTNTLMEDDSFAKIRKYEIPKLVADTAKMLKEGKDPKRVIFQTALNIANKYNIIYNPASHDTLSSPIQKSYNAFTGNLYGNTTSNSDYKKSFVNNLTNYIIEDAKKLLKNKKYHNKLASYATMSDVLNN